MTDAEAIELLSRWVTELQRENTVLHHTLRHSRASADAYRQRMKTANRRASLLDSRVHRYWVELAAELDPAVVGAL